jgi:hypothetical protein
MRAEAGIIDEASALIVALNTLQCPGFMIE